MLLRDEILHQALTLSPADRAYVADILEQSLVEAESTLESGISGASLAAELQRRSAAYRDDATTARNASELLAELRQRQEQEMRS